MIISVDKAAKAVEPLPMDTIAERLRASRNAKGLSQMALAVKAEIQQSQIAMVELPKYGRHLTLAQAVRIAGVLQVSLDWLATGKGTPPALATKTAE